MGRKSHENENRSKETAGGPESSFSLTRQAQTNHYDRRTGLIYLLVVGSPTTNAWDS
jgi:hypothetical protein